MPLTTREALVSLPPINPLDEGTTNNQNGDDDGKKKLFGTLPNSTQIDVRTILRSTGELEKIEDGSFMDYFTDCECIGCMAKSNFNDGDSPEAWDELMSFPKSNMGAGLANVCIIMSRHYKEVFVPLARKAQSKQYGFSNQGDYSSEEDSEEDSCDYLFQRSSSFSDDDGTNRTTRSSSSLSDDSDSDGEDNIDPLNNSNVTNSGDDDDDDIMEINIPDEWHPLKIYCHLTQHVVDQEFMRFIAIKQYSDIANMTFNQSLRETPNGKIDEKQFKIFNECWKMIQTILKQQQQTDSGANLRNGLPYIPPGMSSTISNNNLSSNAQKNLGKRGRKNGNTKFVRPYRPDSSFFDKRRRITSSNHR